MGCGSGKLAAVPAAPPDEDEDAPDIDPIIVPQIEPGYPPPKPPTYRKNEVFKEHQYGVIDNRAKAASQDHATTYETLIAYLTANLKTDIQKLRAIFMWLGSQRIYNVTYRDVTDPHTPRGYMKLIKHKLGFYPGFFALLCRAAHLPCVIVRGRCKGTGYEVGDTDVSDQNTSWNVVYVDKSWRIVHPFWAFTGVVGLETGRWTMIENTGQSVREKQKQSEGIHIYSCDEFFFLPDPDEFVYICMALSKEWQLLKHPWDEDDFVRVPHFQTSYFTSGLTLVSEHLGLLKVKDGKKVISFEHSPKIDPSLSYTLFFDESRSEESIPKEVQLDKYVLQNNEKNIKSLIIRFPVRGIYMMKINGDLCSFRIDCEGLGENQNPFPMKPTIGFGYGQKAKEAGLLSPSNTNGVVVMEYGTVKKFVFKSKKKLEFEVFLRHYLKTVQNLGRYVKVKTNGDEVTVTVTMPDASFAQNPEYGLEINAKEKGSGDKFENVCNYFISSDKKEWDLDADPQKKNEGEDMKKLRRRLIAATSNDDVEELDKAITAYTAAGLDNKKDLSRARQKLRLLRSERDDKDTVRKRMVVATAGEDVVALEKAVREFLAARLDDQGDLTAAKTRLVELQNKRLKEAIEKRGLEFLDKSIRKAEKSVVSTQVVNSEVMNEARDVVNQLQRLQRFLHPVLKLKGPTVSELHSYQHPKPLIHDIMTATYIILREKDKDLKSWEYVQALMRRLGQDSLIRRIQQFDLVHLPISASKRADSLLNKYKFNDVRQHSAGAGTFYVWSNNIIKEQRRQMD